MRRALTVGVDDYSFGGLSGCVEDALSMGALLATHADGSPNFDVHQLVAPDEEITRAVLREQITKLFAQPAEVALLFFAGHGTENDLGGYLVTQDAEQYDQGVAMKEVLELANTSMVSEVVIILDCCHSGHLGNTSGPRDFNAKAEMREGVSILTASRSSEPSVESGGHGLFTTLVCSALAGGAADVIGNTTVGGVYAYVDQSLGPWEQRPLFKSHVSSFLSLRQGPAAVERSELRRIVELFEDPDTQLVLDPSYERTAAAADPAHVATFDLLALYRNARLVRVSTHEHLYFAAMQNGSVELTALGRHYWRLVDNGRV